MTDCVVTGINVGSARERVNGALRRRPVDHHSPVAKRLLPLVLRGKHHSRT